MKSAHAGRARIGWHLIVSHLIVSRLIPCLILASGWLAGCGSQDTFRNSLTFGTGITGGGFELAGEATNFSLSSDGADIWFRLESAADFDGRFVRLYIYSGTYPYSQKDYTLPQPNGHILLSSFRITDPDSYTVKAYLVEEVVDIGVETHVIDAPLAMGP
jgi:hypothetical protein